MRSILFFSFPYYGHTNSLMTIARMISNEFDFELYAEISQEYAYMLEDTKIHFLDHPFVRYRDQTSGEHGENLEALYFYADGVLQCTKEHLDKLDFYQSKNPALAIYDGYSIWGREIAIRLHIPCIANLTTQIFDENAFTNNIKKILYGYTREGMQEKNIIRELNMFESILKRKYAMIDFKYADCLCALGDKNFLYYYPEMSCFPESIDDRCVLLGPYLPVQNITIPCDKKVIYISFGTILKCYKLLITCIDACKDLECLIYVSAGECADEIAKSYKEYKNVIVSQKLPQIDILMAADLFISHGGQNSVMESVYLGTPILSIPQANDAFILADYIEKQAVGEVIPNEAVSVSSIRETGIKLMSDQKLIEDCKRLSENLKQRRMQNGFHEQVMDTVRNILEGKT